MSTRATSSPRAPPSLPTPGEWADAPHPLPVADTVDRSINRDPEFFPEPDRFAPERYIERWGKPFPQKAGNYAFGAGRRVCPGQHIAERALFIAMSTLLHHFTFDVARDPKTGRELKPDIFSFTDGFNSRPETFEAVIKPRRGQQTIDLLRKERDAAKEDLMRFDV